MRIDPQPEWWPGRTDPLDGVQGNRWHHIVQLGRSRHERSINLLGLASDEGVIRNQGRPGAKNGPSAIRKQLANLAVHAPIHLHDLGDVICGNGRLESAQDEYALHASSAIGGNQLVIGMGGGHEIAFASYFGLRQAHPKATIGILNFDAHFDLRRADQRTSGTPFLDALTHSPTRYFALGISRANNTQALFRTAQEHEVGYRLDSELITPNLDSVANDLRGWLSQIQLLYMSIDLDVFPASVAPGVSAPAALGVGLDVVLPLVQMAASSGKLAIADVAELNPSFDIDHRTARLAARLIYEIADAYYGATSSTAIS